MRQNKTKVRNMRFIKEKIMNDDLFERLKEETGATYISDLRYSPYRENAIRILVSDNTGGVFATYVE